VADEHASPVVKLAVYILISMAVMSIALTAGACVMVSRLVEEPSRPAFRKWLAIWSLKGLLAPCVIWVLLNTGLTFELQPLMPSVQAGRITGEWVPPFLKAVGLGSFVIASYWAAMTLGWVLVNVAKGLEGERKSNFTGLWIASGLGMAIIALVLVLLGGGFAAGIAVVAVLAPVAGYAPSFLFERKMPPMYAKAIAKMKFGKYTEAEWELIRQLERAEDDFQGWMMMAELYAVHFHDVPEAEQTILEICDNPKVTPPQISVALHKLADWQLSIGENPEGARSALQMVQDRCRGTHLARMAQVRMQQLPRTADELRERKQAEAIPLPALGDQLDSDGTAPQTGANHAEIARVCTARLAEDPNNIHEREKLARVLAEHLGRADDAIEQLTLLLDMPDQPEARRAEWLSRMAAWTLKYKHDGVKGRELLNRLVREFPGTAQAFAARQRLERFARGG
jgi:hypothetical protein